MTAPTFPLQFGIPGGPELLIILLIAVLLFGANKIPKLARSTGEALGEFQKGREEVEQELQEMRDTVEGSPEPTGTPETEMVDAETGTETVDAETGTEEESTETDVDDDDLEIADAEAETDTDADAGADADADAGADAEDESEDADDLFADVDVEEDDADATEAKEEAKD